MPERGHNVLVIIEIPYRKEEKIFREPIDSRESEEIISEFIRTGKNQLFETLVKRYQNKAFRLALSILGPGHSFEAEDITQEVFIRVFRQLSQFNFKSKFGTWLYRITYNIAVDYKRKARSSLTHPAENAMVRIKAEKPGDDPYKTVVKMEQCKAIQVCMQELPDIYRSVLYLYYWLGHSVKEITEYLGAKPETVKSYLHRGRQKLHRKMKQRGIVNES